MCLESKGSLNCGLRVKSLGEKFWVKRPWYLVATLYSAIKCFVGIEVYHKQQISEEGPEMGFTMLRERV